MKTIKDILKKYSYSPYPKELLKELEEYKTQAIKQAFDETKINYAIYIYDDKGEYEDWSPQELDAYNEAKMDKEELEDKFLKL